MKRAKLDVVQSNVNKEIGKMKVIKSVEIAEEEVKDVVSRVEEVAVLNAPLAFSGFVVVAERAAVGEVAEVMKEVSEAGKLRSFVGHAATAELIKELTGVEVEVNRGMWTPKGEAVAVVFRLKRRLARVEDVKGVKPEEIDVMLLHYRTQNNV